MSTLQTIRKRHRYKAGTLLAAVSLLAFSGCSAVKSSVNQIDSMDPALKLGRSDYQNMGSSKKDGSTPPDLLNVTVDKGAPPIPPLAEILAAPRPPKIGTTQLVSIAVTDDVPLKDVLLELAKLADVDIELDAGITGGISFIAKEKPFNEVIERVADLAGLRYSMKNGVLRVERDTPFIRSYAIDFLNVDKSSDSSVSLSTNVLSSSGGGSGGGSGVTNGTTANIKSTIKGDFWESLKIGLDQIVDYKPVQRVSSTVLQAEGASNTLGAEGGQQAAATPAASSAAPAAASGGASAGSGGAAGTNKNYTLNRQAGILTFNGTSKQQEMVETLLNKIKNNASAQVLIEAKIIEVTLDDAYKTGINWSAMGRHLSGGVTFNTLGNAISASSPTTNMATVSLASGDIDTLLSAVQTFGTTRTLSSPRLHAINNQPSTLTFATNKVYFKVTTTAGTSSTVNGTTTQQPPTVNASAETVPVGIIMSIIPSIDTDNSEVTLSVHPTLSTIAGYVDDPSVAFLNISGVKNQVPEVQVRDLDSTVRMKSGETMVIGGLMKQDNTSTDTGIPLASEVPLLGNLFKSVDKDTKKSELIILIKASIVGRKSNIDKTDKLIFHKFSDDPRPVSF